MMRLSTARDIGALIRDRRRRLGLRQAELAERIGVSRLWISEVERGKASANVGLVLRALQALGLEIQAQEKQRLPADAEEILRAAMRRPAP